LKTKNSQQVLNSGLIPNSAGYELLDLKEMTGKQKINEKKWIIQIRSTLINKWSGNMSVLDKDVNSNYNPDKYRMALQRDFMIDHNDFLNMFSASYIASRRDKHNYYSDYYLLNIPANNKNSLYLKFDIKEEGWFDFCVKQFDDNRVPYTAKSRANLQDENQAFGRENDDNRYLKVKFILVRDNSTGRGPL